jgi:hypothetical protein
MTFETLVTDTPFSEMTETELVEDKEFSDDDYFLDIEGNFN